MGDYGSLVAAEAIKETRSFSKDNQIFYLIFVLFLPCFFYLCAIGSDIGLAIVYCQTGDRLNSLITICLYFIPTILFIIIPRLWQVYESESIIVIKQNIHSAADRNLFLSCSSDFKVQHSELEMASNPEAEQRDDKYLTSLSCSHSGTQLIFQLSRIMANNNNEPFSLNNPGGT